MRRLVGGAAALGRRLVGGYLLPVLLLMAAMAVLATLLGRPGFYAVKLVVVGAVAAFTALLWERTRRTNRLLARFVAALTQADLTQSFRSRDRGAGLDELAAALDGALARLRAERLAAAADNRFAAALAEEVPTPLLTIGDDGIVRLVNKAARRLFREADNRPAAAFARYGGPFATALGAIPPGGRQVCHVLWNGLPQRALLTASAIERGGRPWRVVAVDVIQGELERAELATQADLVRVLTHEIMNSLTPVTSLAASAAALLDELDPADAATLAEARAAVATLARRAAAIGGFVDSYREFGRTPSIAVRRFAAEDWLADLARTFTAMPQAAGVALTTKVSPPGLRVVGDPELLGQVVLNLLKNGAEAAVSGAAPAPAVSATVAATDADRTLISVTDTGRGFPAALLQEVFLPFFTTKAGGTGIGLSFARQVVLLHGGVIEARPADGSGGKITILV